MKYFFFTLFIFATALAQAQPESSFTKESTFINYLMDNQEYRNAIYLLKKNEGDTSSLDEEMKNSFNYMLGWSYYNIKAVDSSASYFQKITASSPNYLKAKFYEGFQYTYMGKTQQAKELFNNLSLTDSSLFQLKLFELAGIALLKKDYTGFQNLEKQFDYTYYPIATEQKDMTNYYKQLTSIKKKSSLLAGVMSAVIPGSGKYYVGYKGQAFSAFLPAVTLGALATESYLRAGPKSPQFLIFAGVFSAFYIGNIWGSALSVKISRDEQYREIYNNIMLDLHIPLRRVFD